MDLRCLRRAGAGYVTERIVNISASGAALATQEILKPGSVLALQIEGPQGMEVPAQAEVAFLRASAAGDTAYVAGIRFVRADPVSRGALDGLLLALMATPEGPRATRRIEARCKAHWEMPGRKRPMPLMLADISLGGALVEGPEVPPGNSRGVLVLEGVCDQKETRIPSTIVWARQAESLDHGGVRFDETRENEQLIRRIVSWFLLIPKPGMPEPVSASSKMHVGPFEVGELVGRGGMCDVYRALGVNKPFEGKAFALKRLRPDALAMPGAVDRFVTEADLGRMLSHRGIVRVHASYQFNEENWMAMDLVEGKSLEAALRERAVAGRLPPLPIALAVIQELLEVLRYCHTFEPAPGRKMEVVHSDVTPSNVLIDKSGTLKLIDFGIASTSALNDLYEVKGVATKLQYMAPELYEDGIDANPLVDIYQAAIVLYEILTGVRPFKAETPEEICKTVKRGAVPPRRLNAAIPAALEQVILRALSADPRKRPQTAAQFAEEIAKAAPCPPPEQRQQLILNLLHAPG